MLIVRFTMAPKDMKFAEIIFARNDLADLAVFSSKPVNSVVASGRV